jgi:hypothetical protein
MPDQPQLFQPCAAKAFQTVRPVGDELPGQLGCVQA